MGSSFPIHTPKIYRSKVMEYFDSKKQDLTASLWVAIFGGHDELQAKPF